MKNSLFLKKRVMETTIKISPRELTPSWLKKVKALFEEEEKLEITIKPVTDVAYMLNENTEGYISRLNSAIQNLESNKDTVTFTKEEFEKLIENLINKK